MTAPDNGTYAEQHRALWRELQAKVAASLKDKSDAQYVANALLEWPEGNDLLRRLVAHLDTASPDNPGYGRNDG